MENNYLLLGLAVVILTGLVTVFIFRSNKKNSIPSLAADEWRRILWERGLTYQKARPLGFWEALRHFGLEAVPTSAYRSGYFAEVFATDENGVKKSFFAKAFLAFDKEILESEVRG